MCRRVCARMRRRVRKSVFELTRGCHHVSWTPLPGPGLMHVTPAPTPHPPPAYVP